jgi:hypothetical protein
MTSQTTDLMRADDWPGAAEFCAEHTAREPALQFAARFADTSWLMRVVLVEEWMECLFALSHVDLARAKLAWWTDEADLAKAGAARHPVVIELQKKGQSNDTLAPVTRAALAWLDQATPAQENARRAQWQDFASGVAGVFGDAHSEVLWQALIAKRQLQWHGKAERYGPAWATRADLAQHQLKANQLGDKQLCANLLQTRLQEIAAQLLDASQDARIRSRGLRVFAALHAKEALHWANDATKAFFPTRIGPLTLLGAWWRSRE